MLRVTSTHFRPWVRLPINNISRVSEPSADQAQTVSRRVEKFAELMQSVWISRNDYERRVRVVRSHHYDDALVLTPSSSCFMRSKGCKLGGLRSDLRAPTLTPWIIRSNSRPINKQLRGIGLLKNKISRLCLATFKQNCGHMV